jgi:hypothetical protein
MRVSFWMLLVRVWDIAIFGKYHMDSWLGIEWGEVVSMNDEGIKWNNNIWIRETKKLMNSEYMTFFLFFLFYFLFLMCFPFIILIIYLFLSLRFSFHGFTTQFFKFDQLLINFITFMLEGLKILLKWWW